jgi:putative intracellular protease/amidase
MSINRHAHHRTRPRRVLGTTMALLLALTALAGVVLAGTVVTSRGFHPPVPALANDTAPASAQHSERAGTAAPSAARHGRRLVVAFVAGASGTTASDLLAPYDIFASSSAFTTYVVANTAAPAPLEGGPAVIPTYTFAHVDADPALKPDLVVVPAVNEPTGATEAPLRRWVAHQHDDGAKVLGVCAGSLVLAATGMLDGLDATSHWSRISKLQATRPAVHWIRGRRYVQDGSVTTTAAVTSGVPAALHLLAQLAGPAEARRVANLHPELHWTPTRTTRIAADHFAAHDWPVGLNYVMPWFRPTVGIALRDGVGELDATAAFEVYVQSAAAGTIALAAENTVRTRHGLVLLTTSYAQAPGLSRVVVPGAGTPLTDDPRLRAWAAARRVDLEPLAGRGGTSGGGFAGALENLAQHSNAATTSATAKMVGYPTTGLHLGDRRQFPRTVLLAVATLVFAVLVGLAPGWVLRRRRRLRSHDVPTTTGPTGTSATADLAARTPVSAS